MKNRKAPQRSGIVFVISFAIILLLIFSLLFVWMGVRSSAQSSAPTVADVNFHGEYRIGNGDWQPILPGEHISATKGDVTLYGVFMVHDPRTGEAIEPLAPGNQVSLYFNHIGASIPISDGQRFRFDAENPFLGEDACAIMRGSFTVTDTEPITLVLHNPHSFGNENAVDEFLDGMSLAPSIYLESTILEIGSAERNLGLTIFIASLIILGIAGFSSVIHLPSHRELWLIGLMSFFAGVYFMFDAYGVSLWNDSFIANTRILGLSMMFYMLFCTALITALLKGALKRLGIAALILSFSVVLGCILLSILTPTYFYDSWLYWAATETVVVLTLIVCLGLSFRGAPPMLRLLFSIGIVTLSAFPVDVCATAMGWWEGGVVSKHVFLAVFLMALVVVLRIIPSHINAAARAKHLEAEQQALQLELQESRISIMLSQMQPHFIFNTLNTIYHLCELDPEKAKTTISSFSEYLRNNIDTLGQSEMISFEKELSFVKTYLDIEKVRFDDELEISMDIGVRSFKLPVLTVQPLVENAVKHGTSKKEGVTQLSIRTLETDTCYRIVITDTGVGFDPTEYANDGHKHVGISSVRQRLQNLCDGTLTIESEKNVGTTATVEIPKKEVSLS